MEEKKERTIYGALANIQAKLNVPKTHYNKFGNYYYRTTSDILDAAKPLAKAEGCNIVIDDDIITVGGRIYIKATATLTNDKGENVSTTAYAREEEGKKGMDASQVTGAASSYARKYALNGLFAIDDTADADSSNAETKAEVKSATPAVRQNPDQSSQNEIFNGYAKPAIEQARSKEELKRIYVDYADLHSFAAFMTALSARKKELGIH